ncbi:hypothetical protein C2S51_011633 [Perilla frutescens var. frutescens]|nr:hypothetical protein C2S51_011633 [Perilla frutescens var. frutescens]
MVCQAASQTRFRALKHENGIPGRSAIVVRVIACFQPLQNCQAEYFRQLLKPVTISEVIYLLDCLRVLFWYVIFILIVLVQGCLLLFAKFLQSKSESCIPGCSFGWMVTAEESQTCQQFSAQNSTDLNLMTLLQQEQNCSLPYFNPSAQYANLAFPGQPNCHLLGLNTGQPNAVSGNPCLKNFQRSPQYGLGFPNKPIDASCAPGKRFLIFDRSGNHTRLFVSPSFSRQNDIIASKVPGTASGLCEKVASEVDQRFLVKSVVEEKWDENNLNDGEGEMLEDTEEINALLYSDSDDEYYDDDDDTNDDTDGENDEVTSTRHTLFGIEDCGNKDKSLEEVMEEVASTDGSPKRRKLLDGNYKKSSLVSVERSVKRASPCNYKDDVESHCGGARTSYNNIDSSKNEKTVKIHEALKILGSIIPGLNSKDPLSIIEKAIVYLESMKMEAKALASATFP